MQNRQCQDESPNCEGAVEHQGFALPRCEKHWAELRGTVTEERLEEKVFCLNENEKCEGAVEYRMSLSGTGTPIPRCEWHWAERLDLQDEINKRYNNRAGYSFYDAGEYWDENDY